MTASALRPNRNASRRLWSSRKRRSPGVRMRWSGGKPSWTPPRRAEDAAKQEEALAADIETRTAELERIAEGDDAFLAQQRSLAERLSAKRMEQLARQKDAELARSQIEALEKQARAAESRRAALEEGLTALAARSGACQEEIEAIRRAKTDSTALIAAKEAEIREATEKRLLCQKDETEALAKGRTAADEREEMGREMARLAERKPPPRANTTRWPRSSGTSIS